MSLIEELMSDPTDVSMLKISGKDLIDTLSLQPGPLIGKILHILLEKALVNPNINTKETLIEEAMGLLKLPEEEINNLFVDAVKVKKEVEDNKNKAIRRKYKVS